jgi:hypothetical protein
VKGDAATAVFVAASKAIDVSVAMGNECEPPP